MRFPKDMRVAGYRPPQWSEDGSTLFFGDRAARAETDAGRASRAGRATRRRASRCGTGRTCASSTSRKSPPAQDRQRTTPVAWHVGANSVARLSDDPYETIQFSENGTTAVANDEGSVRRAS